MSAQTVLERLERVKQTGPDKYLARCPAHSDKSPSLSIRDCDDGRVLIHCFAGCGAADVLTAIGLDFAAVMPELDPGEYRRKPSKETITARRALKVLESETRLVAIAASNIAKGIALKDDDLERIHTAAYRIRAAGSVAS